MADLRGVVRRLQESIDGLGSPEGTVQGSINEESMNYSPISGSRSYVMTPPRLRDGDNVICKGLDKEVELGMEKETPKEVVKKQLESFGILEKEMRQSKRLCSRLELALKESNDRVKVLEQKEKEQKKKIDELEGRVAQTSTAWKHAEQSLTRNRKRAEELGNEKYNLLKKLKRMQEELGTAKRSSDEGVNLRKENEKLNKKCSLLEVSLGEYKSVEKAAISDLEALAESLHRPVYISGTVASPSSFLLEEGRRRRRKSLKSSNQMEEIVVKLSNEVQRLIKEWKAARDGRKEALKEAAGTRLSCEELQSSLDAARRELSKVLGRSTLLEEKLSQRCLAHTTLLEASAAAGESLSRLLPVEERKVLESSLAFAETGVEQDGEEEVLLRMDTDVYLGGFQEPTNSTLDIENEAERGLVRKARLVPLCAWRLGQVLEHGAQVEEELASMRSKLEEADHSAAKLAKEVNDLKSMALERKQTENLNATRASECEQVAKSNAERAMAELAAEKDKNEALATRLEAQAVKLKHYEQLKESTMEQSQISKTNIGRVRVELVTEKENNAVLAGRLKTQMVELQRCEQAIESATEREQIAKADAEKAKGELAAEKENNATLAERLKIHATELQHLEELKDSGKESLRLIARFFLPLRAHLYELKSQKRFLSEQFRRYSPVQEALHRAASCVEGRNYWALPKSLHAVDIAHSVVTHPVEGDCLRLPPCFRSVAIAILAAHRMINLMHMKRSHDGSADTKANETGYIYDMACSLTDWSSRKDGKGGSSFFSLPPCLPDSAVRASPEFLSVDKLTTQAPEVSLHMLLNCLDTQTYQWTHRHEEWNGNGGYCLLTWLLRGNASHYTRLTYLTERTPRRRNEVTCTGVNRVLRARAAYVDLCRCLALGDMQLLNSLTRTTATLAREMNRLLDAEGKKMESSCVLCEASKEREKFTAEATAQAIKTLEAERSDAASLAHALHSKAGDLKRCTLAAESALAIAREDRNETAESLRKAEYAVKQLKEEVCSLNKEKGEYSRQKKVLHPLQNDLAAMRNRCRELEQRADQAEAGMVYLQRDAATVHYFEEQRKVLVQEQTIAIKSLKDIFI